MTALIAGEYVHYAQRFGMFQKKLPCIEWRIVVKFALEVRKMKDIPMFTTEFGVASLSLSEVPYRKEAYIRVRSVSDGKLTDLLTECIGFCRAVGAETVYASESDELTGYPLKTAVLEMQGDALVDWQKVEHIFPVTEQTVSRWREITNSRMADVDCAMTLTAMDEKRIISSGGAYFIHHDGELLGTGWMEDEKLLMLCGVKPGVGERILHTLMSLSEGGRIRLEVASTNERAIRLYEKCGFLKVSELNRWYRVFG